MEGQGSVHQLHFDYTRVHRFPKLEKNFWSGTNYFSSLHPKPQTSFSTLPLKTMTIFFFLLSFLTIALIRLKALGQRLPSRTGRRQNAVFDRFLLIFREFRTAAGLPVMQSHISQCCMGLFAIQNGCVSHSYRLSVPLPNPDNN